MFSKKANKIDEIFTLDLTSFSKCQIEGEDFDNFFGPLWKHELYLRTCTTKMVIVWNQSKLVMSRLVGLTTFPDSNTKCKLTHTSSSMSMSNKVPA